MQRLVTALAAVALASAACSSDSKSTTTTDKPSSASTAIDAAKGGTLTAGAATLDIPAGSLPGNVTVSVTSSQPSSSLPDVSSVKGLVYEFGPEGTKFDPPATLKLPLPEVPGKDQVAVMSWLDTKTNTWVDLESSVSGSQVSAPVAHFTTFVIRFKGVEAGAVDCSFSACGGNVVGEWNIQGACVDKNSGDGGVDAGSANGSPFGPSCPTATVDVAVSATGTATFNADLTFTLDFESSGSPTITVPADCLSNLMVKSCDDLNKVFNGGNNDAGMQTTCTTDAKGGCSCTGGGGGNSSTVAHTGTYTVSGNVLTTTQPDAGAGDPAEFCVNGSVMKVKISDNGTILTLKKK